MSLRRFLDCAYAALVEQWQGIGRDLLTAVEQVNESLGLGAPGEQPKPTVTDNDRALKELQAMMAGVKR
jgi:hypothetical protein